MAFSKLLKNTILYLYPYYQTIPCSFNYINCYDI